MANRTYISTTTRRSPKPRSDRLRAIGAGSVTSTVISLGGSSGGGTAGEDGFSPTISFETEGSVLTVRVVNKTGIKEYEIDLGECTGVDALREDFEECCREMTEEVRDLRDTIDELKRMMNVVTFTVVPTPADAKVTINGEERASVSVFAGAEVEWSVEADGYITRTGSQTVTENTTVEVVLADLGSLISSFSYDDIDAGGGSVLPKVEVLEGAALTYSGTGVDKDTGEVSADSLGTTLKARTRVTAVTLTAELNGSMATASADVYQQANEVVRHEATGTEYGKPAITGGHTYDDIDAGGGTVTPTAPAYNQTKTTGYTDTYTSGATAPGEYEDEVIRSGADITYSGTGVDTSTGAVRASSLGTTEKARTKVATSTVTVTMNGLSASKETDVYQQANEIVSTSDEETYGTPSVSLSYAKDIPAGGGTVTPTLSYSQTHTTGHSETYTSGEVATDGTTETITSGAEVTYGSEYSYPGEIDPSTGAVSAGSLGTTFQGRSISAAVTATVTLNGKSGTAAATVWQQENKVESTGEEVTYEDLIIRLTYSVDGVDGADIPAGGGTATPDLSYTQEWHTYATYTYTSGATSSEKTGDGTDTGGGDVVWSGEGVDTSTGEVTAPSLGTTVRERTMVAEALATVTLNGVTDAALCRVYQQANEIVGESDEETYGTPSASLSYEVDGVEGADIPAGGGTATPALSYSQTHTTGHSETYTSGEVATDGTTETITTGAEVSYGSEYGYPGAIDPSTGAVSADSLGTTVQGRSISAAVTATVTMNGKSGTAAATVWQQANKVETTGEEVDYEDLIIRLTYSVDGVEGADIPAWGGTATPDLSYSQEWHTYATYTYTSGATSSEKTGDGTDTGGGDVVWSGEGVDTSTGAVTAPSLGTTVRERTMVAEALATVTLNGVTDAALCRVYQQANEVERTTKQFVGESLEFGTFEYADDIPAEGGTVYPTVEVRYIYEYRNGYVYTSGSVEWDTDSREATSVTPDELMFADNTLRLSPIILDTATGAATAGAATSTERQSLTTVAASAFYTSPETGEELFGIATAGVWQEAREVWLRVDPDSLTFGADGGTADVAVDSSTDDFEVEGTSADWIIARGAITVGGGLLLTVTARANTEASARSGSVTLANGDGCAAEVAVTQEAASSGGGGGGGTGDTRTLTLVISQYRQTETWTIKNCPMVTVMADGAVVVGLGEFSDSGSSMTWTGETADGAQVEYTVAKDGYATVTGSVTMDSDKTVSVSLRASD